MLRELRIRNIVLIEQAVIPFEVGFNVLSGETGSGKSALLAALSLLAGERADSSLIRQGAEKGSVEGLFEMDGSPALHSLLDSAGIEWDRQEPLLLRREVTVQGKGRAFINNQVAQLALLKRISAFLFEQISQHANRQLLSTEEHRNLLDLYGGLTEEVAAFRASWEEECRLKDAWEEHTRGAAQRIREIEIGQHEMEELKSAAVRAGEEEELFAAYTRLTHAEEVIAALDQTIQILGETVPALSRQQAVLDKVARIDASFAEASQSFRTACVELSEVIYALEKGLGHCQCQPERTAAINDRLTLINRLKKKYGPTVSDLIAYQERVAKRLFELENSDLAGEQLQEQLQAIQLYNEQLAATLSQKRQHATHQLIEELTPHLRSLNMPKAEFEIAIMSQKRNGTGDDHVEFFLKPNLGERRIAVKECASGGELSRLMLALQTLLAGKQQLATLIFDEIDANIGGTTAATVGEKLRQIGRSHQVIAITHFPQVAQHADHHIQIAKREREGRTLTEVIPLIDASLRKRELARMRGVS